MCIRDRYYGFEHGNHFVGLSVGQRIKGHRFVLFPKVLVLEFHKTGEHRAIVHMMTVDNDIVCLLYTSRCV